MHEQQGLMFLSQHYQAFETIECKKVPDQTTEVKLRNFPQSTAPVRPRWTYDLIVHLEEIRCMVYSVCFEIFVQLNVL